MVKANGVYEYKHGRHEWHVMSTIITIRVAATQDDQTDEHNRLQRSIC